MATKAELARTYAERDGVGINEGAEGMGAVLVEGRWTFSDGSSLEAESMEGRRMLGLTFHPWRPGRGELWQEEDGRLTWGPERRPFHSRGGVQRRAERAYRARGDGGRAERERKKRAREELEARQEREAEENVRDVFGPSVSPPPAGS